MPVTAPKPAPTVNAVDVFFQKPVPQNNKGPTKPRDPFAAINQPQARAAGNPFSPATGAVRDPFASIDFLSQPAQQPQSASLSDLASNPFFASSSPAAAKPAAHAQPNPFDPF